MNEIDVSIIVPLYNAEKYVRKSILSVINQTFKNYEIIIVNDGSTDNSVDNIIDLVNKYNNIRLIYQTNKGAAVARNVGIRNSNGEWIYFLDSDDYIDKDLLKICFEECTNNNLDVLHFDGKAFYDENFSQRNEVGLEDFNREELLNSEKIYSGEEFFYESYRKNAYRLSACLAFFRKKFLMDNELFFTDGLLHEDQEFVFKAAFLADRIKYIPNKIFYRRVRENSVSQKISFKTIDSIKYIIETNMKFIKNRKGNINKDFILSKYFDDLYIDLSYKASQLYEVDGKFGKEGLLGVINYCLDHILDTLDISIMYAIRYISEIIMKIIKDTDLVNELVEYILKRSGFYKILNNERLDKVKNLELCNSEKTIGIYGLGTHTSDLIKFYEENIEKIRCKIIFIDSFKETNSIKFLNREVINVKDIVNYDFDKVIISSYGYQEELYKELKKYIKYNTLPIVKLYTEDYPYCVFGIKNLEKNTIKMQNERSQRKYEGKSTCIWNR
ncbi:glycosyltransferase family 2 protein [Clostridium felsineum]|uniref:glycosyltransferase family 2 protein n=1 Tax=Clostridium felsineum TaxID=36839 RepID=UPI0009C4665A|nr:glycosyltransferase [Clostridium felsineum]URZ00948.1 hypothetical protein CLAUR_009360 [Clostridium felsineum]